MKVSLRKINDLERAVQTAGDITGLYIKVIDSKSVEIGNKLEQSNPVRLLSNKERTSEFSGPHLSLCRNSFKLSLGSGSPA